MKKTFASFAALLMVFACLAGMAISEEDGTDSSSLLTAQVTTEKGFLNLRKSPEEGASVLGHIPNGSIVTVLSQGDVFWEIQYDGTQGYAMCRFLTLVDAAAVTPASDETPSAAAAPPATGEAPSSPVDGASCDPAESVAQVTTGQGPLNLRKSPQSNATVLERIPNRSLVAVLSQGEEYWEVQYGDTQGYAMCAFLTMTDYTQDVLNYRLLYRGNAGDDVLALKNRLLELGYYRSGSTMNDQYNETCVERLKMFQEQNGLNVDGIASAAVQATLFSDSAAVNTQELPKPKTSGYVIASSSSSSSSDPGSDDFDWNQWMLEHPGVCPCCMGKGCACCNWTGKI